MPPTIFTIYLISGDSWNISTNDHPIADVEYKRDKREHGLFTDNTGKKILVRGEDIVAIEF